MKKDIFTQKIMYRVAREEEKRIKRVFSVLISILLPLAGGFIFAFHRTISNLVNSGVVDLINFMRHDWRLAQLEIGDLRLFLGEVIEWEIVALLLVTLTASIILLLKSDVLALVQGIKEIRKYTSRKKITQK